MVTMSEANKALAARMPLEVFVQGNLDVVDEVLAPDFIDHGPPVPGQPPGPEGVKLFAAAIRQAFPDLDIQIEHAVAEADLVALHITASGTMQGELAGMPPSGKRATWSAVHLDRIADGKVVEHWVVQDQFGMLQQLGFIPAPEGTTAG
jgi:predicted ester cyclase